jgi:ABC-type dipeptide/oligopeptide/nickel transport system permease subunit
MRVVDIMLALPSLLLALVLVAIFGPSIGNARWRSPSSHCRTMCV